MLVFFGKDCLVFDVLDLLSFALPFDANADDNLIQAVCIILLALLCVWPVLRGKRTEGQNDRMQIS